MPPDVVNSVIDPINCTADEHTLDSKIEPEVDIQLNVQNETELDYADDDNDNISSESDSELL
jgi:hypothetical protein